MYFWPLSHGTSRKDDLNPARARALGGWDLGGSKTFIAEKLVRFLDTRWARLHYFVRFLDNRWVLLDS